MMTGHILAYSPQDCMGLLVPGALNSGADLRRKAQFSKLIYNFNYVSVCVSIGGKDEKGSGVTTGLFSIGNGLGASSGTGRGRYPAVGCESVSIQ
jgi:hypothetical protein